MKKTILKALKRGLIHSLIISEDDIARAAEKVLELFYCRCYAENGKLSIYFPLDGDVPYEYNYTIKPIDYGMYKYVIDDIDL